MAGPSGVEEIAAALWRSMPSKDLRAALRRFKQLGYADDEGDVTFVPALASEPVFDMFHRARHMGAAVVFVTIVDDRLHFRAMRRMSGPTPPADVRHVPLPTLVGDWFQQVTKSPVGSSWVADGVPDTVPAWMAEQSEFASVDVA